MDWLIPADEIIGDDVDDVIGSGSFGCVHLKRWRRTQVAVKLIDHTTSTASSATLFQREFDVMTKMHHPNIVQLLGFVDDPFAIVMEYLPGGSLADRRRGMRTATKRGVALDVLRGLSYMHNRVPHACIHRDVKPRNILFTPSGTAKIADLGLSKLVVSRTSLTDAVVHSEDVGTERYAAPETRHRKPTYDAKIDVYSAGVVLYELFEDAPYAAPTRWSVAPCAVRALVRRMIEHDPALRPGALECYDEMERFRPRWWWCTTTWRQDRDATRRTRRPRSTPRCARRIESQRATTSSTR